MACFQVAGLRQSAVIQAAYVLLYVGRIRKHKDDGLFHLIFLNALSLSESRGGGGYLISIMLNDSANNAEGRHVKHFFRACKKQSIPKVIKEILYEDWAVHSGNRMMS